MEPNSKPALIPDQLSDSGPDSFMIVPRDSDTAVAYWSVTQKHLALQGDGRLCLHLVGCNSPITETIILYREAGHFIVPLMGVEREYLVHLGWVNDSGFTSFFSERIELPPVTTKQSPKVGLRSNQDRVLNFMSYHSGSAN